MDHRGRSATESLSSSLSSSPTNEFPVANIVNSSAKRDAPQADDDPDNALFSDADELLAGASRQQRQQKKATKPRRLHLPSLDHVHSSGEMLKIGVAGHSSVGPARSQLLDSPRSVASGAAGSSAREKLSVAAVVVHLCKGNIGPGAMSLPNGFSQAGIYAAPVLFVVVALVCTYNMDLLLRCKRAVGPTTPMSFGDVGREILGPKGKLLIDVFLVGMQLGICCVYFTFVATNIHVVLPERLQSALHERQLILAVFPVLLLLSWMRTLKRITPFSGLANIAVVAGIAIVFYYSFEYYEHPTQPRVESVHFDWRTLASFYGTAVYSFEGIGLILPIQNEMQSPALFPRVLAACMLAILVLFLAIGEAPTIAFGRITNGSMTAVLHDYCEGWGVTAANVLLAFACTLSFPIQFYPAIEVLEKSLSRPGSLMRPAALPHTALTRHRHPPAPGAHGPHALPRAFYGQQQQQRQAPDASVQQTRPPPARAPLFERVFSMTQYECNRTVLRSMICTSLLLVAVCIPDVGLLISLFGAVGSSMLAIILPPVMYLKLHKHSLSLPSRVFHAGIVVFGVVGMAAGTLQALVEVATALF
ncbi:hypothetical protein PybrP1_000917 [[Pythium] brassicae (nom. inval.)]|nr:hypothetical protein PybrP1_000917 [[Pythium] brassicae (nom. inval.)]